MKQKKLESQLNLNYNKNCESNGQLMTDLQKNTFAELFSNIKLCKLNSRILDPNTECCHTELQNKNLKFQVQTQKDTIEQLQINIQRVGEAN